MLASRCTGLAIKKLYPIQYWTTKYAEAQPLAEDACSWQYTPDTWTNLHDWRHKHMFTSLKVCNLKFICMGLAIFAGDSIRFPPPVDHVLSELSAMTRPSGMALIFNELHKPLHHDKTVIQWQTTLIYLLWEPHELLKARKIWQQKMSLPGLKASSMLTWTWANSERWWEPGSPGVLQFVGSQRVRHD